MLTEYIHKKMASARYKILDDGSYFGEVPSIRGVWANAKTLEACRRELQEVLEDWILLTVKNGETVRGLSVGHVRTLEYA